MRAIIARNKLLGLGPILCDALCQFNIPELLNSNLKFKYVTKVFSRPAQGLFQSLIACDTQCPF